MTADSRSLLHFLCSVLVHFDIFVRQILPGLNVLFQSFDLKLSLIRVKRLRHHVPPLLLLSYYSTAFIVEHLHVYLVVAWYLVMRLLVRAKNIAHHVQALFARPLPASGRPWMLWCNRQFRFTEYDIRVISRGAVSGGC